VSIIVCSYRGGGAPTDRPTTHAGEYIPRFVHPPIRARNQCLIFFGAPVTEFLTSLIYPRHAFGDRVSEFLDAIRLVIHSSWISWSCADRSPLVCVSLAIVRNTYRPFVMLLRCSVRLDHLSRLFLVVRDFWRL